MFCQQFEFTPSMTQVFTSSKLHHQSAFLDKNKIVRTHNIFFVKSVDLPKLSKIIELLKKHKKLNRECLLEKP